MEPDTRVKGVFLLTALLLMTTAGAAHEVYVLPADAMNQSMSTASPDPFTAIQGNQTLFAAFILSTVLAFAVALYPAFDERFTERYAPILESLKPYAPYAAQATLGLGLIASASAQHLFGPELPLHLISENVQILSLALFMTGLLLLFNIETRLTGLFSLLVFIVAYQRIEGYLMHYAAYLGLSLFVILQNKHPSLDEFMSVFFKAPALPARFVNHPDKPYLFLRIFSGGAIIYAAVYAKYLHSNLALATIEQYALAQYLPFGPLFLVLCAFIVEVLIGAAFIFGVHIRLAAFMLLGFNVFSFVIFQEALWPHIWMIGVAITVLLYGYDEYTVEGVVARKKQFEPLL